VSKYGPPSFSQKSGEAGQPTPSANSQAEPQRLGDLLGGIKGKLAKKLKEVTHGQHQASDASCAPISVDKQSISHSEAAESHIDIAADPRVAPLANELVSTGTALEDRERFGVDSQSMADPGPVAISSSSESADPTGQMQPPLYPQAGAGTLSEKKVDPVGLTSSSRVEPECLSASFAKEHTAQGEAAGLNLGQEREESVKVAVVRPMSAKENPKPNEVYVSATAGVFNSELRVNVPTAQIETQLGSSSKSSHQIKSQKNIDLPVDIYPEVSGTKEASDESIFGLSRAKFGLIAGATACMFAIVLGVYFLHSTKQLDAKAPVPNITQEAAPKIALTASEPVESTPAAIAPQPAVALPSLPSSAANGLTQVQTSAGTERAQDAKQIAAPTPKPTLRTEDNRTTVKTPKAMTKNNVAVTDPLPPTTKRIEDQSNIKPSNAHPAANLMKSSIEKSVNEIFNERVSAECTNTLAWIVCREAIRISICQGKWSEQPEPGASICRGASGR
jgi:hypothetical protein